MYMKKEKMRQKKEREKIGPTEWEGERKKEAIRWTTEGNRKQDKIRLKKRNGSNE